jgi:hypothetical protein
VSDKALTLARKESAGGSAPDQRMGGSGGASHKRANYRVRSLSGRTPSLSALSTTAPARKDNPSPVPKGVKHWEDTEN